MIDTISGDVVDYCSQFEYLHTELRTISNPHFRLSQITSDVEVDVLSYDFRTKKIVSYTVTHVLSNVNTG